MLKAIRGINMTQLIRLVYASRATFEFIPDSNSMFPELDDILMKARQHNQRFNIGGVLYFADGYFFQCLEGKEANVNQLLEKITLDPRHESLKISYCKNIRRRCFKQWSMKFVPKSQEVDNLIRRQGYSNFAPTEFKESDINLLIDLFTRLEDSSLKNKRLREFHKLNLSWWKSLSQRLTMHSFSF